MYFKLYPEVSLQFQESRSENYRWKLLKKEGILYLKL